MALVDCLEASAEWFVRVVSRENFVQLRVELSWVVSGKVAREEDLG